MNTGLICGAETCSEPVGKTSCPRAVPFLQLCCAQGHRLSLPAPPDALKAAGIHAAHLHPFTRSSGETRTLCSAFSTAASVASRLNEAGCRASAKPSAPARAGPLPLTPVGRFGACSPSVEAVGHPLL